MNGVKMSSSDWADILGISYSTIRDWTKTGGLEKNLQRYADANNVALCDVIRDAKKFVFRGRNLKWNPS